MVEPLGLGMSKLLVGVTRKETVNLFTFVKYTNVSK